MFGKLRTHGSIRRKTLSHPPSVRPQMEQLEDRTVPSTFNSLLSVGPHAADLRSDLADVKSDVTALTRALGTTSGAVTTDIGNVNAALTAVSNDLKAGTSATADLKTLVNAGAALVNDLGTNVSPAVRRDLRDLTNDVKDLSKDAARAAHLVDPDDNPRNGDHNHDRDDRGGLTGNPGSLLGQAAEVQSDLTAANADVAALTKALGANPAAGVTTALNNVNADLTAVSNDLTSGAPTAADLQKLATDQAALANAVGTGASSAVRQDLRLLGGDVTDLSTDVGRLTNGVNRAVTDIQNDASQLTRQLGSNLGQTATTALGTLNGDLTTLASDLAAGKAIGGDLTTALNDEFALINAVGGQASGAATHTFYDLAADLTNVALAVSVSAKV